MTGQFFTIILLLTSRYFKNWLNNLKRLPFIRTTRAPQPTATFYARITVEDVDEKKQEKKQRGLLKVPSISSILAASTIDIARSTALAQIKSDVRSKSTTCLPQLDDSRLHENILVPNSNEKFRRKSNEIPLSSSMNNLLAHQQHKRSNSFLSLIRQDGMEIQNHKMLRRSDAIAFSESNPSLDGEAFVGSEIGLEHDNLVAKLNTKSNTFPRIMSSSSSPKPTQTSVKKLKKSLSQVSSQVSVLFKSPIQQPGLKAKPQIKRLCIVNQFSVKSSVRAIFSFFLNIGLVPTTYCFRSASKSFQCFVNIGN